MKKMYSMFIVLLLFSALNIFGIKVYSYEEEEDFQNETYHYEGEEKTPVDISNMTKYMIDGKNNITISNIKEEESLYFDGHDYTIDENNKRCFVIKGYNQYRKEELQVYFKNCHNQNNNYCAEILTKKIKVVSGKKNIKITKKKDDYYIRGKKEGKAFILLTVKLKTRDLVEERFENDDYGSWDTSTYYKFSSAGNIVTIKKKVRVDVKIKDISELTSLKNKGNKTLMFTVDNKTKKNIVILKNSIYCLQHASEYGYNFLGMYVKTWEGDYKDVHRFPKDIIIKPGERKVITLKCDLIDADCGVELNYRFKWKGKRNNKHGYDSK